MRMANTYSSFSSTERSSGVFEFPLRSAAVELWSKHRECIVWAREAGNGRVDRQRAQEASIFISQLRASTYSASD
jgi:hypothetical protein